MMKKMENGETVIGMLHHWSSDSSIGAASALCLGLATMRRNIQRWQRNIGGDIGQCGASPNINVDGTSNKQGTIKYFIQLDIMVNRRQEKIKLLMTGLGKQRIILGFPWLNKHNPEINWQTGELNWRTTWKLLRNEIGNSFSWFKSRDENLRLFPTPPEKDKTPLLAFIKDEKDEEEHSNGLIIPLIDEEDFVIRTIEEMENESNIWINAKTTTSQLLHQTHDEKKKDILLKEQIPDEYHEFLDVFDKKKADRFPEERIWDHKIELKDRFIPKSFKNYNLTPMNKWNWINFWKKTWKKDTSDCHNPPWLPHFSLSLKKMQES